MNRELTTEEKIIRELAEKYNPYDRNLSSRHLFSEGFIIGYEFSKNAEQFKDAVLKAPESKLPTDEEIEKWAESHALFTGFDGKPNMNIARQVSFMQGAKWMRDQK